MPRLGMCSSNLNMKILLTDEARKGKYISSILKLLEHFYFYVLNFVYVRRMW